MGLLKDTVFMLIQSFPPSGKSGRSGKNVLLKHCLVLTNFQLKIAGKHCSETLKYLNTEKPVHD